MADDGVPEIFLTRFFCLIKINLSGNIVWPQACFQKLAKMDNFLAFLLLSTSLARNNK